MTAPDYRMDAVVGVAKHMRDVAHDQIAQAENRVVPLAQQVVDLTRKRDLLVGIVENIILGHLYTGTELRAAASAARGNEVEHG